MNSTLYIDKSKPDKAGKVPLYFQVTVNGIYFPVMSKEKCLPDNWNGINVDKDKKTNAQLVRLKKILDDLEDEVKKYTPRDPKKFVRERFKQLAFGKQVETEGEKDFFFYFDEWIEESKGRVNETTNEILSPKTIGRYGVTRNHLYNFQLKKNYILHAESIDDIFFGKFRSYFISSLGNSPNSFSEHIKNLKSFCKWWQKRHKTVGNDFRDFKKSFSYSDAEPLYKEELAKWYNLEIPKNKLDEWNSNNKRVSMETLQKANLIFMALCNTAMRIDSDYNKNFNFNKCIRDVFVFDGEKETEEKMIVYKSGKSKNMCYVPYFDDMYFKPVWVLNEMIKRFGEIPKMSGQKLNDYLEALCFIKGFTRIKVTSKTGRKTYATLKLLFGVNPDIIMMATGHKTRGSFDAYVGINTSDIIREHKAKARYVKVA